jgi:hypothetical protein
VFTTEVKLLRLRNFFWGGSCKTIFRNGFLR